MCGRQPPSSKRHEAEVMIMCHHTEHCTHQIVGAGSFVCYFIRLNMHEHIHTHMPLIYLHTHTKRMSCSASSAADAHDSLDSSSAAPSSSSPIGRVSEPCSNNASPVFPRKAVSHRLLFPVKRRYVHKSTFRFSFVRFIFLIFI